jgi:type II secretory pathway pseudopilin PulG
MAEPQNNHSRPVGFRISELVLVLVILMGLGLVFMPKLYDDRREDNERQAQDVLRMIGSAQQSWRIATGEWAELYRLQFTPGHDPSNLEPFLPFLPFSADFAHYGGYRFQELTDGLGRPTGCRAEPTTPPFSGERSFELAYGESQPVQLAPLSPNSDTALQ